MPAPAFGFALDSMRNPFGADDAKLCQKSAPRDGGDGARSRHAPSSNRPPKKTPRQIPPPGRTHIPFYLLPNQNFTFTPAYSERPMPGTAMPQGMLLMPMVVPWPV